jgi:maltooligosyltrehalose trehalohydrolase
VTRFGVWAPRARRVDLVSHDRRLPMQRIDQGSFALELEAPEGMRYAYSLNGADTLPDPGSRHQPDGVHGPSAVVDPSWAGWTDGTWKGADLGRAVIYELHVGTFTPEGTFDAVIGKLDHLVALGITAVELMPVAEFTGERGWGYDGVDLYAAHHAYGGPRGLDRLVDACHARGLAVVLDVVYNHLGPDGNYLERFGPYFTDRHQTPWGEALNFDGPDSAPVRAYVIENALSWMRDHHVDGVRVDAVHAMVDGSAVHVLEELTARVDELEEAKGRKLWVIAESDLNDPKVVRPREQWGWGCDAQWSDDFHHSLHALLTEERRGYYADFGTLADLAKALRDVYVYDGRWSAYRRRVQGRPFGDLSGHRALAYAQDHDQVGNRARGERLTHLVDGARLRIAAALVLTSPYVPMLFMGEEWAASTPFQYFTDHRDHNIAQAVTEGRRYEFGGFGWRPEEVVDAQDPATFTRSRLDWSEPAREPHRGILEWYRSLIALRQREAALTDGRRDLVDVQFDEGARWMRIVRGPITVAFSVGSDVDLPLGGRAGELVLASDPRVTLRSGSLHLARDTVAVIRSA